MKTFSITIAALTFITLVSNCSSITPQQAIDSNLIKLPPGFKIDIYAQNIPDARSMTLAPSGVVFVGSRTAGNVYALLDRDNDKKSETLKIIASDLRQPNGVAFFKGDLYVAEISRILRYDNIENNLDSPPAPVIIYDSFPTDEHHGWKYIAFGPDEKLYVPVGAPCNICESKPIYASITRMNPDGSNLEIFAQGVRNTVGFDWHPDTNELWFTDNGRDWMGDNSPPDELNKAPTPSLHFGFPFCHGTDIPDPEFGKIQPCENFTKPQINLGPHVAALGMLFYTGRMFPPEYKNQIFIAEHGSWNRSTPLGYRIMLVTLNEGRPIDYKPFAQGWLQNRTPWGRPVALLQLADGSLLLSDDKANTIYRISYSDM